MEENLLTQAVDTVVYEKSQSYFCRLNTHH
jgi:hypothetical protein